jgi:hypothetical protein
MHFVAAVLAPYGCELKAPYSKPFPIPCTIKLCWLDELCARPCFHAWKIKWVPSAGEMADLHPRDGRLEAENQFALKLFKPSPNSPLHSNPRPKAGI